MILNVSGLKTSVKKTENYQADTPTRPRHVLPAEHDRWLLSPVLCRFSTPWPRSAPEQGHRLILPCRDGLGELSRLVASFKEKPRAREAWGNPRLSLVSLSRPHPKWSSAGLASAQTEGSLAHRFLRKR